MKNGSAFFSLILVIVSILLTSCGSLFGDDSDVIRYNDKMESATGTWRLLNDEDTYFCFDGSDNMMTFSYFEDGAIKYSGKFRVVHRSSPDASTPLSFVLTRDDKPKEDWLNCYVENFDKEFTQFSIMFEEEDQGVTDGTVYTHIYRISEMPYKIGTYVLDGKQYKAYSKNGFDDGEYRIPEGRYVAESGESFTVLPIMNESFMLFQYVNGDDVIEGIFNIAQDRQTIYLYIEHDIYQKIKQADKDNYDTTFSLYYPPDFYLRGNFDTNDNSLVINGLYHHDYSPSKIEDSVWVFATYVKQ